MLDNILLYVSLGADFPYCRPIACRTDSKRSDRRLNDFEIPVLHYLVERVTPPRLLVELSDRPPTDQGVEALLVLPPGNSGYYTSRASFPQSFQSSSPFGAPFYCRGLVQFVSLTEQSTDLLGCILN